MAVRDERAALKGRAMVLDPLASHPSSRSYVLKLHRDARPQEGLVFGRLESMVSGRSFAFGNANELLRCLVLDTVALPGADGALAHDDGAPR